MSELYGNYLPVLTFGFVLTQILYSATFLIDLYLYSRPINWVDPEEAAETPVADYPEIVLFYPVLRELEETMRTTLIALDRLDYPPARRRVVAVPNADDLGTIASLRRLQAEFPFLELMPVPPTTDPSWRVIWEAWEGNEAAYWWWKGRHARNCDLPPKKTRQLIYAFYTLVSSRRSQGDFLVNYIDADSCPPPDHFLAGVAGMRRYDVLQASNIAGNLNASLAASWHAFDHMVWDGLKYPHLSADGHPFWMLGKGLFFRASDLWALGGFHPWLTIEDPEVGMRFFAAGKRLGVIKAPLIEEVPETFGRGVTQRKRWVCGFFQSLGEPLERLGFTPLQKLRAWINFLPCLSLWVNAIGLPFGLWAFWALLTGQEALPWWTLVLAGFNLTAFAVTLGVLYWRTWARTALVLSSRSERLGYMLRINPVFILVWWTLWLIPIAIGFWMYLRGLGLVWERTEKINANQALIESRGPHPPPTPAE